MAVKKIHLKKYKPFAFSIRASVFSKLGKIEIDNENKVLRITYRQKVKQENQL